MYRLKPPDRNFIYTLHCVLFRFMLELQKEQKLEYVRKVTSMASDIGYTVSTCTCNMYVLMYTHMSMYICTHTVLHTCTNLKS